jgi:hypothetical protein
MYCVESDDVLMMNISIKLVLNKIVAQSLLPELASNGWYFLLLSR